MRRFFLNFNPENRLIIDGEQFVHLAFVLRLRLGDRIVLTKDDEFDYIYEIVNISKKSAELKFIEKLKNICNSKVFLRLFVALEKGDKMDLVVQKAVELGVSEIVPITTAYCQVKPDSIKTDRLQRIANEACKQCGRSKTAFINNVRDIKNLQFDDSDERLICFLYEGECTVDLNTFLTDADKTKIKYIDIIIGSEGGFSPDEVNYLSSQGITPLTLGKRILRAETACIAVCSIVMAHMGELK